jgi:chitin disaccharide deacetylase
MSKKAILFLSVFLFFLTNDLWAQETYAEKLGFPKGAKVLILHVDDVGMSWDSNQGAIDAIEKGVATSLSIMMPCSWVPGFAHYMKEHPNIDAGLHLTLTAEWKDYRWGPLSGNQITKGLVDEEGALWATVEDVVKHATADEVETEIRAQLDRARKMGIEPTHLDSHMGTLFAKPEFIERYAKVGIENKIPVMFPAGNMELIGKQLGGPEQVEQIRKMGTMLWNSGLPVLDDLHSLSYDFVYPKDKKLSDAQLQKLATDQYKKTIQLLKPGLTMVIAHCTSPSSVFQYISNSHNIRKGDLLAMTDPNFKKFIMDEGIILTTWREVKARRDKVK